MEKKCSKKTSISPFKTFPPCLARSTQSKSVFNCEGVAALLIARFAWIENYSVAHWNLCGVNVSFFLLRRVFWSKKREDWNNNKKKESSALWCECALVYLCGDTCSSNYDFVAPYVTSFNFRSQFNATFRCCLCSRNWRRVVIGYLFYLFHRLWDYQCSLSMLAYEVSFSDWFANF